MRVRSNSLLLGGGLHLLDFHCGRHTLLQNPKSPTESCSGHTKKKREEKAAEREIFLQLLLLSISQLDKQTNPNPAEVGLQLKTRISRLKWRNSNVGSKIGRDCKFENT